MTTAQIILSQLGGNKFLAMTGAKNLVDIGNGLQFKIGRTHHVVKLTADDLYDYEGFKINAKTFETSRTFMLPGVQAEDLRREVSAATGLALSL